MNIHIFIEIFLSLCILTALEIAVQRTQQRDHFADLFKNTLDRYEELKVVTKLQREAIEKSNCSDSKDCKSQ